MDKANSEGHVLSKIKTNSCYTLVCFIFDKTFLLVLYPLQKLPFGVNRSGRDELLLNGDFNVNHIRIGKATICPHYTSNTSI